MRRLTFEARLLDPDLSPDEQTIVAVQEAPGRRDLVLIPSSGVAGLKTRATSEPLAGLKTRATSETLADLKTRATSETVVAQDFSPALGSITTLISEPETQFNAPRWSPDGGTIAVERHRLGGLPEIVVVDVTTRLARVVASDANARLVTPTWRPDGRAIVAAADLRGGPFNLYEFTVDASASPQQLTHLPGGATWPDVSADGRTIVFVGYTTDGFDVFQMPYPVSTPASLVPQDSSPAPSTPAEAEASGPVASRRYTPLPTLKPTSWSPIVESDGEQIRGGAETSGFDVLGYHSYFASATWLISGPSGAVTPNAATPDWQVYYAYRPVASDVLDVGVEGYVVLRRPCHRQRCAVALDAARAADRSGRSVPRPPCPRRHSGHGVPLARDRRFHAP